MNVSGNVSKLDSTTLSIFQTKWSSDLISAVYVVVTVVNLCGNGLSMWLLLFRTSPKTPSIIFMINLTITDLVLGLMLPFQIMYQLQGYNWTLGPSMCNILTVAFFANMYCSILTMTAISVERYMGIVKVMRFREQRNKTTYAICSCMVMWVIVLAILSPLETTDLTFNVKELNITTCFDVLKKDMLPTTAHWAAFLFGLFVVLFFCPFIITVYCYVRIICTLIKNSKNVQKGRAIRLAFTVLFVFVVCFAPNNILLLAHSITRLFFNKSLYMYYKLSLSLSCINSCLDPFIYYFASKEFRRKMRQLLRLRSLSTLENEMTADGPRESFFSGRTVSNGNEEDENLERQVNQTMPASSL
ncbi:P2Y purinoceptor 8 [Astyanax mexicanus]|uniref:P2Y purinoceptor 8 n=1 Tax=Astyanax mexicanus TaxID=7994 RepID=UPI0020CB14FC|nr:P2Y purinoceptor 8 [Astyanax mexicanus]